MLRRIKATLDANVDYPAAVVGATLLRERGVRGGGTAGSLATADPLIAAVPALVGVAAGVAFVIGLLVGRR